MQEDPCAFVRVEKPVSPIETVTASAASIPGTRYLPTPQHGGTKAQ